LLLDDALMGVYVALMRCEECAFVTVMPSLEDVVALTFRGMTHRSCS
jgi:hypothetical protein